MKTVTTVEMQSRLCEILARQDAITQVTHQGKPVIAVLALERYQALLTQITSQQGKPVVAVLAQERYQALPASVSDHSLLVIEVTREGVSQGQRLFHSYSNRLAPRFQSHEQFDTSPLKEKSFEKCERDFMLYIKQLKLYLYASGSSNSQSSIYLYTYFCSYFCLDDGSIRLAEMRRNIQIDDIVNRKEENHL